MQNQQDASRSRFLSMVLPFEHQDGYINLHWLAERKDGKGKMMPGRPAESLDEFLKLLKIWGNKGNDVYQCMSSQRSFDQRSSVETGKAYRSARRLNTEVVRLKSFFLDIDVKPEDPEKCYISTEEALEGLELFCAALDLPDPSAMVASGTGGFHVYWSCKEPITQEQWQPVANALVNAAIAYGFKIDHKCTVDSVRVLRVPGTLNFKTNPPSPVELKTLGEMVDYADFADRLKDYTKPVTPVGNPVVEFNLPQRAPLAGESELGGCVVVSEATNDVSIMDVIAVCPTLEDAFVNGGKGYDNPLWRMTLMAAMFTSEGRDAAHQMSSQHEDYTEAETDREYDRCVKLKTEKDLGWPRCNTFLTSGSLKCKTCPLFAKGQSPFHHIVKPQAAVIPTIVNGRVAASTDHYMPPSYTRSPDNFIIKMVSSGDPNDPPVPKKISDYKFFDGWLQTNPWTLHFTTITHTGKAAKIELPLGSFGAMGGAAKLFGDYGMAFNDNEFKLVKDFCVAWIKRLQQEKDAVFTTMPYGWVKGDDGEIEGFSYAGSVWGNGTQRPAPAPDKTLFDIYSPHGKTQPWMDVMKLITDQERPSAEVIVAASFAAPLMRFTGHDGLLLSGVGETGTGKSTSLDAGLSVWANPKTGKNGLSDTGNSTFEKLGAIKVLPIYWDEIQSAVQLSNASDMIFQLTGGVGKARLSSDIKQRQRSTWQTMIVTCTNVSLIDTVAEKAKSHIAGLMRIFEFPVERSTTGKGRIETGVATRMQARLESHFGNVGLQYAKFMGANHARIAQEVGEYQDKIRKELKAKDEERYWVGAVCLLLMGAKYANEMGVAEFHLEEMKKFLFAAVDKMRTNVHLSPADLTQSINIETIFTRYLTDMRAENMLETNRIHTGVGKPPQGYIKVMNNHPDKLKKIFVHIGRTDGKMRVSVTQLTQWLHEHKFAGRPYLEAMEKKFGANKSNARLGSGTPFHHGQERLYEIDMMAHKDYFQEFLD